MYSKIRWRLTTVYTCKTTINSCLYQSKNNIHVVRSFIITRWKQTTSQPICLFSALYSHLCKCIFLCLFRPSNGRACKEHICNRNIPGHIISCEINTLVIFSITNTGVYIYVMHTSENPVSLLLNQCAILYLFPVFWCYHLLFFFFANIGYWNRLKTSGFTTIWYPESMLLYFTL